MSDGVPKSRVTLTYDTRQPEEQEKERELPFRLMVLGDVGGDKKKPFDQRKVQQLNGRNLGEVMAGLKVQVKGVQLGDATVAAGKPGAARPIDVLVDSVESFSPDDILKLLTGQKAASGRLTSGLRTAWAGDKNKKPEELQPADLWAGDTELTALWKKREEIVGFLKSYQNSKTLRDALKAFSAPPTTPEDTAQRKEQITKAKAALAGGNG
jgi:type VI secretion system ImpB/VipA family protein